MAIEIDPLGAEPQAILQSAAFRGARVLEVGAGSGRLTFRYAEQAGFVVGIDPNETDIRSAGAAAAARCAAKARFLRASATQLPFGAGEFDMVLLSSSL
jgi:ubiquinone/menaquinone biosynthesis C-methylase UbiE